MKQRVGLFYLINRDLESLEGDLVILHGLFEFLKFIPYSVDYEFHMKRFKYIGISPLFDEIEEGVNSPEYDIIITVKKSEQTGKKSYKYKVEKK